MEVGRERRFVISAILGREREDSTDEDAVKMDASIEVRREEARWEVTARKPEAKKSE